MRAHKHYIVCVTFAFTLCKTRAVIHSPLDYEYDSKNLPVSSPIRFDQDRKHDGGGIIGPAELFGRILGNLVVDAANSPYNYPNSDPHDLDHEFEDRYNEKTGLDDHFESAYDDDPKLDGFGYDKLYQSHEYSNDDRHSTKDAKYLSYSTERLDSQEKTINSFPESNVNNKRFETNENVFGSDENSFVSKTDNWLPVNDQITPKHEKEINYVEVEGKSPQENIRHSSSIFNRNFDGNNEKTFKVMTVKKFMFQAQPVKPKNEKTKGTITLYYSD